MNKEQNQDFVKINIKLITKEELLKIDTPKIYHEIINIYIGYRKNIPIRNLLLSGLPKLDRYKGQLSESEIFDIINKLEENDNKTSSI